MIINAATAMLAMAPPSGQTGQSTAPIWVQMAPMILVVVVFYLFFIRPQTKKAKEHAELLKTVRSGDRILISGGILGVVVTVKEKSVFVRSGDSKFEILKTAISEITERGTEVKE